MPPRVLQLVERYGIGIADRDLLRRDFCYSVRRRLAHHGGVKRVTHNAARI